MPAANPTRLSCSASQRPAVLIPSSAAAVPVSSDSVSETQFTVRPDWRSRDTALRTAMRPPERLRSRTRRATSGPLTNKPAPPAGLTPRTASAWADASSSARRSVSPSAIGAVQNTTASELAPAAPSRHASGSDWVVIGATTVSERISGRLSTVSCPQPRRRSLRCRKYHRVAGGAFSRW